MWKKIRSAFTADGLWDNEYAFILDRDVRKVATAVLLQARRDPERNDTAYFKNREKVSGVINRLRKTLKNKVAFHHY